MLRLRKLPPQAHFLVVAKVSVSLDLEAIYQVPNLSGFFGGNLDIACQHVLHMSLRTSARGEGPNGKVKTGKTGKREQDTLTQNRAMV